MSVWSTMKSAFEAALFVRRVTRDSRAPIAVYEIQGSHELAARPCSYDIVFVHGLGGSAADTWREGTAFWPAWLVDDLPEARVLAVDYGTQVSQLDQSPEITFEARASLIAKALVHGAQVGRRPVVFVAHSLGGIHVQALLANELDALLKGEEVRDGIASALAGAIFIATPHEGAVLADLASLTGLEGADTRQLQKPDRMSELDRIHRDFVRDLEAYRTRVQRPIPKMGLHETLAMRELKFVVPQRDAMDGMDNVDEPSAAANGDHIACAKFIDRHDSTYQQILGWLRTWRPKVEASPLEPLPRRLRASPPRAFVDGGWQEPGRSVVAPSPLRIGLLVAAVLLVTGAAGYAVWQALQPPREGLAGVMRRDIAWGIGVDALGRAGFTIDPTEQPCECPSGRSYTVRTIAGDMGILNASRATATVYQGRGLLELVVFLDGDLDEARSALREELGLPDDALRTGSIVADGMRIRVATNRRHENVVRLWNQAWFAEWESDCGPVTPCPVP